MGLNINKLVKLLILFIIMSFLPLQLAQSATFIGTLYSSQTTQPIIDGKITDTEWSTAQEQEITLFFESLLSTLTMNISMRSTYDIVAGTISFAFIIPDTSLDISDGLYIIFKTNDAEDLFILDSSFAFGSDHDLKTFAPYYNMTLDALSTSSVPLEDTSIGGTDDGSGKCRHDSGQYTVEMTFPLASNDSLGKDFNLTENSQIDFTILYFKEGTAYTQILDSDYEYCTLVILERTNLFSIEIYALIASILSTMILFVIIKRKRN